jgi:hypothetical protein
MGREFLKYFIKINYKKMKRSSTGKKSSEGDTGSLCTEFENVENVDLTIEKFSVYFKKLIK